MNRSADPDLSETARELWIAIGALARRLRAERRDDDTSPLAAIVLNRLHRTPGLTPRELADAEHAAPQTLTRILTNLEDRNLITRRSNPADGRQSLLEITAAGRRALRQDSTRRETWLIDAMERQLTVAEQQMLGIASDLLQRLVNGK